MGDVRDRDDRLEQLEADLLIVLAILRVVVEKLVEQGLVSRAEVALAAGRQLAELDVGPDEPVEHVGITRV